MFSRRKHECEDVLFILLFSLPGCRVYCPGTWIGPRESQEQPSLAAVSCHVLLTSSVLGPSLG